MNDEQELKRLVDIKPQDMTEQDVLALHNRRQEIIPLLQAQHKKTARFHNNTGRALAGSVGAYLLGGLAATAAVMVGGAAAGMSFTTAAISFAATAVLGPVIAYPLVAVPVLACALGAIVANAVSTNKVAKHEAKLDFLQADYEPASRYSVSNRKNVGNVDDQAKAHLKTLRAKLGAALGLDPEDASLHAIKSDEIFTSENKGMLREGFVKTAQDSSLVSQNVQERDRTRKSTVYRPERTP